MLYGMYEQGWLGVGKENVLAWLERAEAAGHDEIAGWSPQTRGKVTSNYLTAARLWPAGGEAAQDPLR
jgi:hypothetical protein